MPSVKPTFSNEAFCRGGIANRAVLVSVPDPFRTQYYLNDPQGPDRVIQEMWNAKDKERRKASSHETPGPPATPKEPAAAAEELDQWMEEKTIEANIRTVALDILAQKENPGNWKAELKKY